MDAGRITDCRGTENARVEPVERICFNKVRLGVILNQCKPSIIKSLPPAHHFALNPIIRISYIHSDAILIVLLLIGANFYLPFGRSSCSQKIINYSPLLRQKLRLLCAKFKLTAVRRLGVCSRPESTRESAFIGWVTELRGICSAQKYLV